jgi:hypothetical protein
MSCGDTSNVRRPFATRIDVRGLIECTAGVS